jgi:hypothetical protein
MRRAEGVVQQRVGLLLDTHKVGVMRKENTTRVHHTLLQAPAPGTPAIMESLPQDQTQ